MEVLGPKQKIGPIGACHKIKKNASLKGKTAKEDIRRGSQPFEKKKSGESREKRDREQSTLQLDLLQENPSSRLQEGKGNRKRKTTRGGRQ